MKRFLAWLHCDEMNDDKLYLAARHRARQNVQTKIDAIVGGPPAELTLLRFERHTLPHTGDSTF